VFISELAAAAAAVGVSFNAPIPGLDNAMLLSNEVDLTMDVEAVLQPADPAA
jgi:hypothetical protein